MNKVFTGFDNSTCETVIDKGNMLLRRNLNEFVIEFYINTVYNRLTVNSFILLYHLTSTKCFTYSNCPKYFDENLLLQKV